MMQQQPIQELFESMFHGKHTFNDFAQSPVEAHYERQTAKTGRKLRTVFKPKEKLRAYHQFLRLFLFDFLPVNEEVVFSYRKGFGALHAVAPHAKSKHFYVCDIENFFPSLKRTLVRETI